MDARQRAHERQKTCALGVANVVLTLCLALPFFGNGTAHTGGTAGIYCGATILFEDAGAYVLTEILAFMAGVVITAVLRYRREEKMQCFLGISVKNVSILRVFQCVTRENLPALP